MALDISLLQSPLSRPEKVSIGLFYLVDLVLCLAVNSFLIFATILYKAVKLDRMSVWLIQNLAVADICHGLFHVLPVVVTVCAGYRWVLGPGLCKGLMIIRYVFIDCNSFLINALVLNKLYKCLRPLSLPPTRLHKILVSLVALLGSNLYTIVMLEGVLSLEVEYTPYLLGCGVKEDPNAPIRLNDVILTCLVVVVPSVTLITFNTALIILAYSKGTSSIKKANLVIIGLITFIYVASNLPYFFWMLQYYKFIPNLRGMAMVKYTRFTTLMLQFSCFMNPVIYYFTNEKFRYFTNSYLKNVIGILLLSKYRNIDWKRLGTFDQLQKRTELMLSRQTSLNKTSFKQLRSGSLFSSTGSLKTLRNPQGYRVRAGSVTGEVAEQRSKIRTVSESDVK